MHTQKDSISHHVCRGAVFCAGRPDFICFDIDIMRLRFQWVPKENDEIDFSIDYSGAYLLVAAQGTACKTMDLKIQMKNQYYQEIGTGLRLSSPISAATQPAAFGTSNRRRQPNLGQK